MPESPEALLYRVGRLEAEHESLVGTVDRHEKDLAVHAEQINGSGGLVNAMERLSRKVDSLNRALYAFAGSFVLAAVTIAVAIAAGAGH